MESKIKPRSTRKQNPSQQTHINDLILTAKLRQQIRHEFLQRVRKDLSNVFALANIVEEQRNKRIQLLNEEIRAEIECANEFIQRSNEQLTSLAHVNPSSNTVNFDELLVSIKNEFREMFEIYMKEFRFDDLNVDDIIQNAAHEFALTEPILDLPDNSEEVELLRKINEKKKQIENEKIEHCAHILMMQREKEELERDIKILQAEVNESRISTHKKEDEEKQQLRSDIESLQVELKEIYSEIEKLRMS